MSDTRILAREALSRLASHRADDRETWLKVGMALHSVSPDLLDDWDRWSRQSERYEQGECERQWQSFKAGGGVTLGTLILWAREDNSDPNFAMMKDTPRRDRKRTTRAQPRPSALPTFEKAAQCLADADGGQLSSHWIYRLKDGSEYLRVVRIDLPAYDEQGKRKKHFYPIHHAADGWRIGDPKEPLPVYNLPEVIAADSVHIFEGEACADLGTELALVSTTSAHGSGGVKKTDWSPLAGKSVVVFPDHDDSGLRYAREIVRILLSLDPVPQIRVIHFPGVPPKGDLVPEQAHGGTIVPGA